MVLVLPLDLASQILVDDNSYFDATDLRGVVTIPRRLRNDPTAWRYIVSGYEHSLHRATADLWPTVRRFRFFKGSALSFTHESEWDACDLIWFLRTGFMQFIQSVALGKLCNYSQNALMLWLKNSTGWRNGFRAFDPSTKERLLLEDSSNLRSEHRFRRSRACEDAGDEAGQVFLVN